MSFRSAELEVKNLGGVIPAGHPEILDMFDEDPGTVWCWKDERTCGASQKFESEQKALEAWRADKLVFDVVLA